MIINPGPHRAVVANATVPEQRDLETIYNAVKELYNSQQNVKKLFIDTLNIAVPQMYRRSLTQNLGARQYRVTDDILDIMQNLIKRYGIPSPQEFERNNA